MEKISTFLTVMSMLSVAAMSLTDMVKKRWRSLDDQNTTDAQAEANRQSKIHLIAALWGGALAATTGLHPIKDLAGAAQPWWAQGYGWVEYVIVAVLVSYGGQFFNESLDLLRAFKLQQEKLKP